VWRVASRRCGWRTDGQAALALKCVGDQLRAAICGLRLRAIYDLHLNAVHRAIAVDPEIELDLRRTSWTCDGRAGPATDELDLRRTSGHRRPPTTGTTVESDRLDRRRSD
jgi:hypothetical protein